MELRRIGRPLKIESPEQMQEILEEYFDSVPEDEITITGICLALGINKNTFYDYAKKDGFKEITDRARMIVENSYEISLRKNGRTGDIFALKNFGWKDKLEDDEEDKDTTKAKELIVKIRGISKDE